MVHMTKRFGPSLFHSGGQGWNQIGIWFAFHSLFLIPRHWGENICIHHMVWTACPFWVISPKGGYNVHLGGMKFPPTICRWPTLPYPASWNDKFTDNINHTPWNCIRNSQVCIHMFRNIYIYIHTHSIHRYIRAWKHDCVRHRSFQPDIETSNTGFVFQFFFSGRLLTKASRSCL